MGLLALYYSAALWIGGIDFALPIGIITGGLVFVPYLGFATGLVLALIVAFVSGISTAGYVASKGAVRSFTQVLARDLAPHGVRANAIAPGLVATKLSEALMTNPAIHDATVARAALRRHGETPEIAGAALFLASDASSYMTGQTLVLDGGTFLLG